MNFPKTKKNLSLLTLKGRGGPPDFKISIFRKTSLLTYPEYSLLFLKHSQEAICKGFGSINFMPNCLWRVPECLGWPKTGENDQITRLYVLIKTLNQKMSGGKKFIYQPRIQKENFKSKPKKIRLEEGLFFWVTLIQAVVSKTLRLFYKIFFCLQNISTLKKSASSYYYEPR